MRSLRPGKRPGPRAVADGLRAALAKHATSAYIACTMSQTQYTIRRVPPRLDLELRRKAHEEHLSHNEMALRALERGLAQLEHFDARCRGIVPSRT